MMRWMHLSRGAVVAAGLGVGQAALALVTTSSVSGSVVGTFDPGGQSCTQASGVLTAPTAVSCGATDGGTVLSPSRFSGTATASAGVLRLDLVAFASTFGYPGVTGQTIGYSAGGSGSAQFIDAFVVTAPGISVGTPGVLTAQFLVDGALGAQVTGIVGANSPLSQSNAALSLHLGSAGASPSAAQGAGFGVGETFTSGSIPLSITLVTPFQFGVPIDVSAKLAGGVSGSADRVINVPAPGNSFDSEARAGVAYGHTVYWGGIQSVTDGGGAAVAGFSALSATGVDYAVSAVPEPAGWLSWLAGLAAVGLVAWRRARRG